MPRRQHRLDTLPAGTWLLPLFCMSAYFAIQRIETLNPWRATAQTGRGWRSVLIHLPKGMPVGVDTCHNTGRQQVLHGSATKDPFFRIGEIWKTCTFTNVEADARLPCIDVEI